MERTNRLKEVRRAFTGPKVSQSHLAYIAGVSSLTVRHAEEDNVIRKTSGYAIYRAINMLRSQRGLSKLAIEELGLHVN